MTDAGDTVVWKFVVTNIGNVTLHDVTVHDPTAGTVTCARTTLQPLEQLTCASGAHVITAPEAAQGKITNTATTTGTTPGGTPVVSPPDSATVTVNQPPAEGGTTGGGDNGGTTSGSGTAFTGAGDVPLMLWFAGWMLLVGILLTVSGLVRRRRWV